MSQPSCDLHYLQSKYSDIYAQLLRHTQHVTRAEVVKGVRSLVEAWLASRQHGRPLLVNCCGQSEDLIGSVAWLYVEVLDLLPEHTLLYGSERDPSTAITHCDVLFVDDWMLSGANACSALEEFAYKRRTKLHDVTYACLTHVSTSVANEQLQTLVSETYAPGMSNLVLLHNRVVPNFDTILRSQGIEPTSKAACSFHAEVNPDTEVCAYPILSDYKIPNQFGSYPRIYAQLYTVDRRFMTEDVEPRWLSVIRHSNS